MKPKDKKINLFNPTNYHKDFSNLLNMVTLKILRVWKDEDDAFNEFRILVRIVSKQ